MKMTKALAALIPALLLLSSCGKGVTNLPALGPNQWRVNLTWSPPASSPDPVAGYNMYRATAGSATYVMLNPSPIPGTAYQDSSVAGGVTYNYYVESVDAQGNQSVPSNTATVSIPSTSPMLYRMKVRLNQLNSGL